MKTLPDHLALAMCCALILCCGAVAPGEEDAELKAAALARADSPVFAQCMDEFQRAQADRDAAVAAIPDVQAIDEELARLARRIQTLHRLRDALVKQQQAMLEEHEARLESAKQAMMTERGQSLYIALLSSRSLLRFNAGSVCNLRRCVLMRRLQ